MDVRVDIIIHRDRVVCVWIIHTHSLSHGYVHTSTCMHSYAVSFTCTYTYTRPFFHVDLLVYVYVYVAETCMVVDMVNHNVFCCTLQSSPIPLRRVMGERHCEHLVVSLV
ncbi:hypothetical protein EON63_25090 [archaeon]|nr:MAG: hypothetical protein EON63_25090 [archaeon]